jgi:uncharacterized protein with beta-barrel porin domain
MYMSKSVWSFSLSLALLTSSYAAVEISNQNITGTNTYALFNSSGEDLSVNGSEITGMSGSIVLGSEYAGENLQGQIGTVNVGSHVAATNSQFSGGDGGYLSTTTTTKALNASGALGLGLQNSTAQLTGVTVQGGSGGTLIAPDSTFAGTANGGSALLLAGTSSFTASDNTSIVGGEGGYVELSSTAVALASGGAGVELQGVDTVISSGTIIGGGGGTVIGSDDSVADGGSALLVSSASTLRVEGGTYIGGTAGSVNGVVAEAGAAIEVTSDSTIVLAGGTLDGDVLISGGTSTWSLESTFTDTAAFVQIAGAATFNLWNDSQLEDVTIEDGTMNFNNSLFTLDGLFTLEASTAAANFNSGLTVSDGGTLDLGLGTVGGSDVTLESGSTVISEYDGSDLGSIDASGALTVESDSDWIIDAGDVEVATGTTFELATAATIVTNITEKDITFSGTGGEEGWLGGISSLTSDGTTLTATYGASSIDVALGVSGDTSTEFGKAMAALSMSLAPGSDGYNEIKSLADSLAAGGTLMTNTYVRTTEMSSTLIGLQSLFSDQIKDRTRSQMNFEGVGFPSSAPVGVSGWESLRSFSDSIENKYGYDELESLVDKVVPDVALPDNTLPVGWQAWGRGYGSFIEQDDTDDFAGYEATVGGGVVGLDKSIDNMLLGVGVGYAGTTLEGTSGRDAQADTMQAVAYFATHGEKAYFDASVSYAFNAVETEYDLMGYTGEYDAHTLGLYIGGGYAISLMDKVLFTPEASILNTLYSREGYTEASTIVGIPAMNYDSYDEWSHLAKLGATLSAIQKLDLYEYELAIQPELRAHWMHEFNAEMDDETYTMGTSGISIGATPMAREEDLVKVGAGMRLSKWGDDTTEVSLDVDLAYGSDGYDAYVIGGQIMHRF